MSLQLSPSLTLKISKNRYFEVRIDDNHYIIRECHVRGVWHNYHKSSYIAFDLSLHDDNGQLVSGHGLMLEAVVRYAPPDTIVDDHGGSGVIPPSFNSNNALNNPWLDPSTFPQDYYHASSTTSIEDSVYCPQQVGIPIRSTTSHTTSHTTLTNTSSPHPQHYFLTTSSHTPDLTTSHLIFHTLHINNKSLFLSLSTCPPTCRLICPLSYSLSYPLFTTLTAKQTF